MIIQKYYILLLFLKTYNYKKITSNLFYWVSNHIQLSQNIRFPLLYGLRFNLNLKTGFYSCYESEKIATQISITERYHKM